MTKKNVKCWADVFTEKEYVIDVDTMYEHICVISGIEIIKKEFEGLDKKKRLRLDPTQAMSKLYNSKYILIFYTLNK